MRTQNIIVGNLVLLLAAVLPSQAADKTQLYSRSGSKVRIEGTSTMHDWRMENPLIAGSMEVGPNFPLEPGQTVVPGKVEARADVFIQVRGFKSLKADNVTHYEDSMDDVMYEHLKAPDHPKITYHLTELTLKEPAKSQDAPYVFEAKGELGVAGVTNKITMPLNVLPLADKKIKISGTTSVKMTDFNVQPPSPKFLPIKTGDDVKLIFDWMVAPRTPTAAASK